MVIGNLQTVDIVIIKSSLRIQSSLIFAIVIRCTRLELWADYLTDIFNGCSSIKLKKLIGAEKKQIGY